MKKTPNEGWAVTKLEDMPPHLTEAIEAFTPYLRASRCRNQWSMDVLVKEDVGYFNDATCRASAPATASQLEIWKNFPEIVYAGIEFSSQKVPDPSIVIANA